MDYIIVSSKKQRVDYKIFLKSYRVEHAIEIPADSFEFICGNQNYEASSVISPGDFVKFYVGPELAMEGYIDDVDIEYTIDSNDLRLTGRDVISHLLDNDANPITYNKLGLNSYLGKALAPYGMKYYCSDNTAFDKIIVSPGENEYGVIERLCKERNLTPIYYINSQTLYCIKPTSSRNEQYVFSNDSVLPNSFKIKDCQISISNDIKNEVIVYGGDYEKNKNIKGVYTDSNLSTRKKRILNESDIETNAAAVKRAKEEFYSINKNALTVEIVTPTKKPIFLNNSARVYIKKIGFDAHLLIDSVKYSKTLQSGAITNITLKLMPGIGVTFKNNDIPTLPTI